MKAPSPAFSFYPKDLLSDGNVAAMTDEELGVYLRLLCHQWLEGSIPSDSIRLARMCRRTAKSFAKVWPAIAPCFVANGDRLINARLDREKVRQLERAEANSRAGMKGAKSRASNKGLQHTLNERFNERATKRQRKPNLPSPFPSPTTEQTDNGLTAVPAVRPAAPPGSLFPPDDAVQSVQAVDVTRVRTTARGVPTGWVGEAGEDWRVQYNAEPKWPRLGRALKPLVDKHGWPTVRQAWLRYLAETEAKYATAERFAETYGHWSGTALPPARAAPGSVSDRNTDKARGWLDKLTGGRDGP